MNCIRLGITGGIGSGKSYVSNLLTSHFGIPVYYTDDEAKRLNTESEAIRQQLTALVGSNTYNANGTLNRQALAQFLFDSSENAQHINAIVHPVVADDFRSWCQQRDKHTGNGGPVPYPGIVAMECAILFESGFDRLVDITIAVNAPRQLCLERASKRDSASTQAIEKRMTQQMSNEERSQRAHFTIENDGRPLLPQIESILKQISQHILKT